MAAGAGGHVVPGARHREVPRSCAFCRWKMNFQCSAEGRRAAWARCDLWRGLEERKEVWHPDDRCWVPCLVWGLYRKEIRGLERFVSSSPGVRTHTRSRACCTPASQLTNQSVRSLLGQTDCCDGAEFSQRSLLVQSEGWIRG